MTLRRKRGFHYSGMFRTVTAAVGKGLLNILFLRTNDVVREMMICLIIPAREEIRFKSHFLD
jgi:hypothetical protein